MNRTSRLGSALAACLILASLAAVPSAGTNAGVAAAQDSPALPELTRDGQFFRTADGRTTILRGVDYSTSIGLTDEAVRLNGEDLDRIASWGVNLLRVRLRDYHAGYFGEDPDEKYLQEIDRIVTGANQRGMYVILGMGGPDTFVQIPEHVDQPLFDQEKFIPGSPARDIWLDYLERLFTRYADWPGVVGFETINEDVSYPAAIQDQVFMESAHADALARLREVSSAKVYFQQPSGGVYQGEEVAYAPDLGDENRYFCIKWGNNGDNTPQERMKKMLAWAEQAGTPLFFCEYLVFDNPQQDVERLMLIQRLYLTLMDQHLLGGSRLEYIPKTGGALVTDDYEEKFWVEEFVRPYPVWAGGTVTRINWNFDTARLELDLQLAGNGDTEIAVSPERTYANGFTVTTSTGWTLVHDGYNVVSAEGISWDDELGRVIVPAYDGVVTVTIAPLSGSGIQSSVAYSDERLDVQEFAEVVGAAPRSDSEANPESLEARLVAGGAFSPDQAACIVEELQSTMEPGQFALLSDPGQPGRLHHTAGIEIGGAVYACVRDSLE